MLRLNIALLLIVSGVWGCSTGNISRGGTLLYGLNQYHSDMQRAGNQLSNWPARQQAAGEFKTVITGMIGASPEFYRLVELDLRKREFTITLRETNVRPERKKEMTDELAQMEEEIAALRPVVKTQLTAQRLHEQPDGIDAIATLGLLGIALDGFSASASNRGLESPSTKVGQYLVTDFGRFASVRAASGQTFRCNVFGNLDDGAGVRCEAGK
jgi:hypothetical protein